MNVLFPSAMLAAAEDLLADFRQMKLKLASAESCTGGLVAGLLTSIAGSSDVFERGFVTYSNEAKEDLLGVPVSLLREFGAVSAQVACAMAEGALHHSRADVAVSVTGVAGPGGGSAEKPVGLVFIGIAGRQLETASRKLLFGAIGRQETRLATISQVLQILKQLTTPAAES